MAQVQVFSFASGATVFMDEELATSYYRNDGRYVIGPPLNDAAALRRSIWTNINIAAAVPVNWQSMPSVSNDSSDYMLPPAPYLNEDPSKSLLSGKYAGRRIFIVGTLAQPMRLRSAGPILDGYRCRWYLKGVWMESMNPGVYGQCAGRAIQGDEILWLEMYECLLDGTSGLMLTGKAGTGSTLNQWLGDPSKGERIRIERVRVRNVRGQNSDGTRDASDPMKINPIKSNWGENHTGNLSTDVNPNTGRTYLAENQRWDPSTPDAQRTLANTTNPALMGQIGWHSANFVFLRLLPGLVDSGIYNCEIINEYGEARAEDNINLYGGSGGTAASPFVVQGCLVYGSQGYDWNYRKGMGLTYDGSNKVTQGATSYQDVSKTDYSGSGAIDDDKYISTVKGSWERNGYVVWRDHLVIGNIASHQGGHDVQFDGVRVYESTTTLSGDPLKGSRAGWQVTDYPKKYGQTRTAVTADGTVKEVWGAVSMIRCEYHGGDGTGSLLDANSMTDLLYNGGSYDSATNVVFPRLAAGGDAQLIADWRSAKQNAGLVIGLGT